MLVRELMSHPAVTTREDADVRAVARTLAEHRITALPVLDQAGRLVGVVSELDLLPLLVADDPRAHEVPREPHLTAPPGSVAEVMTRVPLTVRPETDAARALALMCRRTVRSLPVVDNDDRVVGVVSRSDLLRAVAADDEEIAGRVARSLGEAGLGDWVAVVADGTVSLTGPTDTEDRALAHLVASRVPGVRAVDRG